MSDSALRAALERELGRLDHFSGVSVERIERLSGGASRQTYAVALAGGPIEAAILQVRRPGSLDAALDFPVEAGLVRAAAARGVPVAEVLAFGPGPFDGAALDALEERSWMLSSFVAGETIARRILRDDPFGEARQVLVPQMGHALAGIHQVPAGDAPSLRPSGPVQEVEAILRGLDEPHPAFELALRWLADHRPDAVPPHVVHGDFRLGNLIVDETGLAAVIDWELAHLGDPREDLGWACVRAWRFGGTAPVAGLGSVETLLDAYRDAGGAAVAPEELVWWVLAGTLRWGAVCMVQANTHRSGVARSVELAAIGRRVCETELDALVLMGLVPEDPVLPAVPEDATSDLHDVPPAAELVDAVGELLGELMAAESGASGFQVRVARNVLAQVGRELRAGNAFDLAHQQRLEALGVTTTAELAGAIRSGGLEASNPSLQEVVVADVLAKVAVANPGYAVGATGGGLQAPTAW